MKFIYPNLRARCSSCKAHKYLKYLDPLPKTIPLKWRCKDDSKCKRKQFMDKMYV